jgi:hypothetical protein
LGIISLSKKGSEMKKIIFLILIFLFHVYTAATEQAVLVYNSKEEMKTVREKMQLKLVRIWGGDEEGDENKFFSTPLSILVSKDKKIYISDVYSHCIQVFDYSGKHLHTIGRKGRGPGDVLGPKSIVFSTEGDLVVNEAFGYRIQLFRSGKKSKVIYKYKSSVSWIGITSKNELAVYSPKKTFFSRKLITFLNIKGKTLREIGVYHDKSRDYLNSEKLIFSIDGEDNIYAANRCTPVIRKYSPDGMLKRVITFEAPIEIPGKIILNSKGNEIEKIGVDGDYRDTMRTRKKDGVAIQTSNRKRPRPILFGGIGIDSDNRIYAVVRNRLLTEKESKATVITGTFAGINRKQVNYDIVENIDAYTLLVFDKTGKILSETSMNTFCEGIYIHEDRIFIIDGTLNQRILEYKMLWTQ